MKRFLMRRAGALKIGFPRSSNEGVRARSLAVVVAAAVVALSSATGVSLATAPGQNGRLVFQRQAGSHVQLFSLSPDGGGLRQLTHFGSTDAVWPAWSPAGTKIAFERDFANHAAIATINSDGTGFEVLTPHGLNGGPSWSPDGKLITFGRYIPGREASIWIMNANGRNVRRVTKNPIPAADPCNCIGQGSSVFSPDGKRIAFTWTKGARKSAVFTVNVNGSGLKQLTPWGRGVADKIDWSPDGSRILLSMPEFGRPGVSANVFSVRRDGSDLEQLTHDTGGTINNGADSWSPDGQKIIFVSNRDGVYKTYWMNADGTGTTEIPNADDAHLISWSSSLAG
jgi:Tol biopolymer transport system component